MTMLTAAEAAKQLKISKRRVAALWNDGVLRGTKSSVGLLLDLDSVHERAALGAIPGRPWSEGVVWAVVIALSNEGSLEVEPDHAADATRRIRRNSAIDLGRRIVAATDVTRYRARHFDRDRPAISGAMALTGETALARVQRDRDVRVVNEAVSELHGYVLDDRGSRESFIDEFELVPSKAGEIFIHSFRSGLARVETSRAPTALIAADCLRSSSTRVRRAGTDALEQMRNAWLATNT